MGTLKFLEILRDCLSSLSFYTSAVQRSCRPSITPQNESTECRPVTPYGIAKNFATQMVTLYRESFGLFACNAICYNHESPRRGESFVTAKSPLSGSHLLGLQDELVLGSLDAQRDWGYAPEYVEACGS